MIFNSHVFVIFLLFVLAVYWRVPAGRRNVVLVVASYVFYGWWDWRFLFLLATSTLVDFTVAGWMHSSTDEQRRRHLLWFSLAVNLGLLGAFKYAGFFVDSFVDTAGSIGWNVAGPTVEVLLPVGISFYTFQTISYTFDVYRRRIAPTTNLIDFATYVAYFPQLVAGPIERAQRLLPRIQAQAARSFPRGEALSRALSLIAVGLFKKVVIADGVAPVVNDVFGAPERYSAIGILAAIIGFSVQIYGDFSGYTDIARGVSELLGIDLVVNFREPYLSRNITEFWRRWHISLSDWLRDYLYIPLGGNRGSSFTTLRNLMVTMLLGGLWHGASFTFVIWGSLHGLFLAAHRVWRRGAVADRQVRWRDAPSVLGTFALVNLAWVFFRSESLGEAVDVLTGLGRVSSGITPWVDVFLVALALVVMATIDIAQRRAGQQRDAGIPVPPMPAFQQGVAVATFIVAVVLFSGANPQPFIYFQF